MDIVTDIQHKMNPESVRLQDERWNKMIEKKKEEDRDWIQQSMKIQEITDAFKEAMDNLPSTPHPLIEDSQRNKIHETERNGRTDETNLVWCIHDIIRE